MMKKLINTPILDSIRLYLLMTFLVLSVSSCDNYGIFDNYGTKLNFKKGELYYTSKVTKEEANKLGEYLVKEGFFTDDNVVSVQLNKEGDTYQFRMVTMPEARDKPETIQSLKDASLLISKEVFGGKKVVVHMCDEYLKTIKEIEG